MKFLKHIAFFALAVVTLLGCQKEYSIETGGTPGTVTSQWEFKEGSNAFKGPFDTAYIEDVGVLKVLTLEGTSQSGLDDFTLQVFGQDIKVGTYKTPLAYMSYLKNGTKTLYETDPTAVDAFTIIISKLDSTGISGTFNGQVKDSVGAIKNIVDGKFSAKLKNTVTPPPTNGQVTFWASEGCTAGKPLTVKISGQSGTITTFTPTEPTSCGAAGTATFTLPAGSYIWKLYCGTDSVGTGDVTVVANGCVKRRCSVTALPQDCKLQKIAEYDSASNKATYAYVSTYTGTIVSKYEMIDSIKKVVDKAFNITYPAGKVQLDANQYFVVGAIGRVTEFHGHFDPTVDTSGEVIIKYTYNASGQLTESAYEQPSLPGIALIKVQNSYTGTNLTKVELKPLTNAGTYVKSYEIEYQYNLARTTKSFMNLLIGTEITLFQTAINTGVPTSTNALIKAIAKEYDQNTGLVTSTATTIFGNYDIDANNYIKSFTVSGDDFGALGLFSHGKYVMSYKCN